MKWTTEEIRSILAEEGEGDPARVFFLLKRRNAPGEFLSKYSKEDYALELWGHKKNAHKARTIALQHKNLPREDIRGFIEYGMSNYNNLDKIRQFFRNPVILTTDIEDLIGNAPNNYDKEKVLRLTASNPRFPVYLYEYCARHENPYIRSSIASNKAIPDSIIEILIKDNNYKVLSALIYNRRTKSDTVARLLEPEFHPESLPSYLLTNLIARLPDGEKFDQAVDLLYTSKQDPATKQLVATISRDNKVLSKLCVDDNVKVRETAMKNPITPDEARVAGALLGTPLTISKRGGMRPRKRVW